MLRRVRIAPTALPPSRLASGTLDSPRAPQPRLSPSLGCLCDPAKRHHTTPITLPVRVHHRGPRPPTQPNLHPHAERGSGSVRQGIAVSPFLPLPPHPVIHGPSTQTGNLLAKPSSAAHLHWRRVPLPPSLSRRRAECGCQPQYEQPHRLKLPDQDCSRPGLPASEHHQGGQGRSSQVGVTD